MFNYQSAQVGAHFNLVLLWSDYLDWYLSNHCIKFVFCIDQKCILLLPDITSLSVWDLKLFNVGRNLDCVPSRWYAVSSATPGAFKSRRHSLERGLGKYGSMMWPVMALKIPWNTATRLAGVVITVYILRMWVSSVVRSLTPTWSLGNQQIWIHHANKIPATIASERNSHRIKTVNFSLVILIW